MINEDDPIFESRSEYLRRKGIELDRRWDGAKLAFGNFRKWILSKVGEPWVQVSSDIHHRLKHSHHYSYQYYDYLMWDIEDKCWIEDGKVLCYRSRFFRDNVRTIDVHQSGSTVYIHPETGLVCKIVGDRVGKSLGRSRIYSGIVIDDLHQLHCIDGIWYNVTLAYEVISKYYVPGQGLVRMSNRTNVDYGNIWMCKNHIVNWKNGVFGHPDKVFVCKHQINKRELRRFGLKNYK